MKKTLLTLLFSLSLIAPSGAHAALTDGLVGHWTLDGIDVNWATGTVTDKSGQGNSGKVVSMSTTTAPVAGKTGQALRLNGTNQWINIGTNEISPLLSGKSAITMSAWIRASTTPASGAAGRAASFFIGDDQTGALIGYSGPNYWVGGRTLAGETFQQSTTTWTNPTQWHHLTGVLDYSNDQITIYVDGVLTTTKAATFTNTTYTPSTPTSTYTDALGVYGSLSVLQQNFGGDIDEVRVYNRALSAAEIKQLYNLGATKYAMTPTDPLKRGLVAHWTFDGMKTVWTSASAGTTLDSSGSGYTGTLTNMSRSTSTSAGKIGQAFKFNGSVQYVAYGNDLRDSDTQGTVTGWFKPAYNGASAHLIVQTTSGDDNKLFRVIAESAGAAVQSYDNGAGFNDYVSAPGGSTTNWKHIAVTSNGSTYTIYIDGVSRSLTVNAGSNAGRWFNSVSGGTQIYRSCYLNATFSNTCNGDVDDIRIYNRALSAAEIKQLYNLGATKYGMTPTDTLKNGLVGHWTFDGNNTVWTSASAGTVRDSSPSANTGTLTNMSRNTSPAAGRIGQAMNFDGSDDYINIPSSTAYNSSTGTWMFWAKVDALPSSTTDNLMSRHDSAGSIYGLSMLVSGTGRFHFQIKDSNSGTNISATDGTVIANDGSWHHVALAWSRVNGATNYLYIDGRQTASAVNTVAWSFNSQAVRLGDSLDSYWEIFDGSLDDVRIYNRILSASEIKQLYGAGRATSN